jgi:hypothetical protein
MPRPRFQPPDRLMGATAFARDDAVRGSLTVVRPLKANRGLWRDLREACDLDKDGGASRHKGNWELVAVAFVVSDYIDLQPWHDDSTNEMWRACGFASSGPHAATIAVASAASRTAPRRSEPTSRRCACGWASWAPTGRRQSISASGCGRHPRGARAAPTRQTTLDIPDS